MNGGSPNPQSEPIRLEGFSQQDLYQKREKIFTRYVGGTFQKLRFYTGWPLLLGYFVTPWLMWGERQIVLFDLPQRQFHILGLTAWPQDFWLLGWVLMIAAFGLFTITNIVGRLWCGYSCPQTVWTSVFMWVEQLTEGERHQRIRLDKAPWGWNKIRRRASKHALWLGWAALTGLTFVGYFEPIRELSANLLSMQISGWSTFWILLFTVGTYVNAGWLREQVCTYMCPYARFQSAMIDKDTLIVSYDASRGDPRGSRKRNTQTSDTQSSNLGDCIDCQLCVQVCPTGIDIRDGLQYECIGCAHCVDACNQVMDKMGYAANLVSYTTERALNGGPIRWLRARSVSYAAVCVVLIAAFLVALFLRSPLAFDIIRERGELYQTSSDGVVHNHYQLKLMNKSGQDAQYTVRVISPEHIELSSDSSFEVLAAEVVDTSLALHSSTAAGGSTPVDIAICNSAGNNCVTEDTTFFAPRSSAGVIR